MIMLCIWMDVPSHYQTAFFNALNARPDVALRVVYLKAPSKNRVTEGWQNSHAVATFESFAQEGGSPEQLLTDVDNWQERIHVINANFSSSLIDYFCRHGVSWCHWSEMPGIRLAKLLGYRMPLFRLLNPLMLLCKRREGRLIRRHALGAFGQGKLATQSFRLMGIPGHKIADLYYTPSALVPGEASRDVKDFARGRRVFLAVGALFRRKGIDVLLRAFARLETSDWCLVLCGLDRSEGRYEALSRKLGLEDRVLFLGAYPSERIADVYNAADVFVLASRFDGWGVVLNEAASIGLPLIGTDLCGGAWHLIENGCTGYRVRAASVSSLFQAMDIYIRSPDLVIRHGSEAQQRFLQTFAPAINAERLVADIKHWNGK